MCPNFEHPALTSSFTKNEFLQVKNSFATIVNRLLVLILFQLSNGDLLYSIACLQHLLNAYTYIDKVRAGFPKLGNTTLNSSQVSRTIVFERKNEKNACFD